MRKFRLKDFAGIAPKYEDNLPVDYGGGTAMAKVAKNCTLSSGKITPISSNLVVNAAVAQANSVVRFENNWYSGNDRYYLISRSSQADILYYLESGVLKKFIDEDQDGVNGDGSDTADVGQERPQQPGLADQKNGSMEADNYDYIITTVRNVGNLALGGEKETTTFDDWDAHYGTPYNVDYTGPNPPDGSVILAASASGGGTSEKHLDTFVSCASNIFSSTGGQGKIEDVDEVTPYDADFLQYLSQPPLAAQGIRDKRFTGLLEDLTVDVPFDAHITSVNVGFRYQHPAGTTGDALRMLLYYNGSWELHPDNHVMNTPIGGSWNDRIQSWATVPGTSDPWTRDDLYNLTGAGISFYYNQGSYSTVHVSHIWVRITYDLFTISGQIETVHDHGPTAVGGEEVTFHEDSQLRAGTSITFDGFGSVLGPDTGDSYTWVPLLGGAPFLDGDVIDAAAASYRYFRIRSSFDGLIEATSRLDAVRTIQAGAEGRYVDESGPSDPYSVDVTGGDSVIRVTPEPEDLLRDHVVFWRIYRKSLATGTHLFLKELPATTPYYDDDMTQAEEGLLLGEPPISWFVSDMDNVILFDKPGEFDGISNDFHAGMLFGWKGEDIFWSEPGLPDAWPAWYTMKMSHTVKKIVVMAGGVAVMTLGGAFRIDGTHPELLQQTKSLGQEPCLGDAIDTRSGVVFLSDSGLAVFDLVSVKMLTEAKFTESWFTTNVDPATTKLVINDNILYLRHSGGMLVADQRGSDNDFTERVYTPDAMWKDELSGTVYVLDTGGVSELEGDTVNESLTWQSGDLGVADNYDRMFYGVRVSGSGVILLYLIVDGVSVATKQLDFTTADGRSLLIPEETFGRALQIRVEGTGRIEQVVVEYQG